MMGVLWPLGLLTMTLALGWASTPLPGPTRTPLDVLDTRTEGPHDD